MLRTNCCQSKTYNSCDILSLVDSQTLIGLILLKCPPAILIFRVKFLFYFYFCLKSLFRLVVNSTLKCSSIGVVIVSFTVYSSFFQCFTVFFSCFFQCFLNSIASVTIKMNHTYAFVSTKLICNVFFHFLV